MKDNKIINHQLKNPQKDIKEFINSIDYINKDISEINNFNIYKLNNAIIDIEINLQPYIEELNNRLNNENLSIKNEIELYE